MGLPHSHRPPIGDGRHILLKRQNMTTLNGKVALITGGARGLGFENARQLGALGATVLISARTLKRAEDAAEKLTKEGVNAYPVQLDVTSKDDLENLVKYIAENYGRLDILINNAAIWLESASGSEMPGNTTSTVSQDMLRAVFEANFFSLVELTQALLPLIRKSEAGRVVNLSSVLGSLTLHADPGSQVFDSKAFAYNASKTAVNAFTIHLAHELKDTTIKVNSVHPGWVRTEIGGPSAYMDVNEGSQTAVRLAALDSQGPTGGFFHLEQTLPW
jgi:NAD(P)-dependent dehydrogenase (short-subunit alcohol dehydrogenase family)